MLITYDPVKRLKTLEERGLDFADAVKVFAGRVIEWHDQRRDYGEPRMITVGHLNGRMVVVVWTTRGDGRRIISMRKANEREQGYFGRECGEA